MARAFPERSECPDVPDNEAIGGLGLGDPSEPAERIIQAQFFTFPPPEPPNFDFGCYGPSATASVNVSSDTAVEPEFGIDITYPDEDETGKCAPLFNFDVTIPPCVTASTEASVQVSSELADPVVGFTATRSPDDPCAYTFEFDLELPGFCPVVRTDAAISVNPALSDPTIDFTGERDPAEPCRFQFDLDIALPEFGEDDVCQARMATVGNVTLSGLQTIDGVVGADGDVILVKDQTDGKENGAYTMSGSGWSRTCEMNSGIIVTVREGSENANTAWLLTTNAPIIVGTTVLTFELISGSSCCCFARAATTENITLSGLQTVDGVSLAEDEICLVKNQSTGSENGPYLVKDGAAWERICEIAAGMTVTVREGNTHARQVWMLVTNEPIEVDTTALVYEIVRAPGNATAEVVTTANITLSGIQNLDGETGADGQKVLATGQSTASQNGLYLMRSGAWERAYDPIVSGMNVSVRAGSAGAGTLWILTTNAPITVGATSLTFVRVAFDTSLIPADGATTGNVTRSGIQTIDGQSGSDGRRVLVKDQTTASENGVYYMRSGAWELIGASTLKYALVIVIEGTANERTLWVADSSTPTYEGVATFFG